MVTPAIDYRVEVCGSLFVLYPLNAEAKVNLQKRTSEESQWWAGGVAVEHRYIGPLVDQLREEGWVVG